MVVRYVPEAGDIAWLDFDPQAGRKQGRRRPALVLTDQAYNLASGLAVVCPHQQAKTVSFRSPRCCVYGGRGNSGGSSQKRGLEGAQSSFPLQGRSRAAQQSPHLRRGSTAYPLIRLVCSSPSSGMTPSEKNSSRPGSSRGHRPRCHSLRGGFFLAFVRA